MSKISIARFALLATVLAKAGRDMLRAIPVKSGQVKNKAAFRQFMGWALLEMDIDKPMFGWLPPKPAVAAFGEERERSGVW